MNYNHHSKQKLGMLILDVKGNYYKQVYEYSKKYEILDDLIVIGLGSNVVYVTDCRKHLNPNQ